MFHLRNTLISIWCLSRCWNQKSFWSSLTFIATGVQLFRLLSAVLCVSSQPPNRFFCAGFSISLSISRKSTIQAESWWNREFIFHYDSVILADWLKIYREEFRLIYFLIWRLFLFQIWIKFKIIIFYYIMFNVFESLRLKYLLESFIRFKFCKCLVCVNILL